MLRTQLEASCATRVLVLCMSAHPFGSDLSQLESGTFRFRDPLNKDRRNLPSRLDESPIKGTREQFAVTHPTANIVDREYASYALRGHDQSVNHATKSDSTKNIGRHCLNAPQP